MGQVGGAHAGFDFPIFDQFVVGVVADYNFVDLSGDDGGSGGDVNGLKIDDIITARGRAGWRFWPGSMVYGTGGAAFTGLDMDFVSGDDDEATYFGWVAGGGIEYAITDNVTFGVEYLHYDFGEEVFTDDAGVFDDDIGLTNDVVRGRLNIKFDSLFN